MPLARKKLKLVESSSAGRNKTRWIRPKVNGNQNRGNDGCETSNFGPQNYCNVEDSLGLSRPESPAGEDPNEENDTPEQERKTKSYEEIKKKDVENWAKLRHQLLKTAVERNHPCVDCCLKCDARLGQESLTAFDGVLFKCEDCGPFFYVCYACLLEDHQLRPNHIPEKWNGKFFEPFLLNDYEHPVQIPGKVHSCLSKYRRNLKFVDSKGKVQDKIYEFCQCEPEALTLHRLNVWPSSSKKPTTVYSQDLLKTLKSLMLECHTSILGFTNSMKWRNGLSSSQADSLYRLLVNESFEEFRNLSFKLETCLAVAPHIDDFSACMQCPKENGKIILMLDGTFGCVRKLSSGKSHETAKHQNRFFLSESTVDQFVTEHSAAVRENKRECSSFKAGTDKLRSKLQRSKLDVTGIFGCSCKHEIPICFLNMKHGERLGYPIFLLQRVMQQYANKGMEFGILYDISCVLDKHIKKAGLQEEFKSCMFATPDWHSYGHIALCQIDYAVRYHPEFGLTDGEGVERLWSFIRRFTAITKEMTPSHRIDLLTDGLIHYGRRKNANIEKSLMERAKKAESIQKSTTEEICTLEKDCGVKITEETVKNWRSMEKTALTKSLHGKGYDNGSEEKWGEHYVEKLLQLEEARSAVHDCNTVQLVKQVQEQIKLLERDIKAVETAKDISTRWGKHTDRFKKAHTRLEDKRKVGFLTRARSYALERIFHLALKRKYSDGQAIPNRLEKMIKKATKRLNDIVQTYNECEFLSRSNIANKISFMDVKDPEGPLYQILDAGIEVRDQLPASIRRRAISLLSLRDRAEEEKIQVSRDAKQFITNCHKKLDQYLQCVEEFTERTRLGIDTRYSTGALTLLWKAVSDLQQRIAASGNFNFSSIFGVPEPNENREMAGSLNDDTETAYMEQLAELDFEDYDDVFDMEANDVFNDI